MQTEQAERIRTAGHIALIFIGIVVTCTGLSLAQSVLAPAVLAFVFGVVLSPISDLCERIGLPRSMAALLTLVLTLFLIVVVAGLTLPVAQRIAASWPSIMAELRSVIFQFQAMLQGIEAAGQKVQEAFGDSGGGSGDVAVSGGGLGIPSTADALFLAPAVLGQTITFAGVLFFFLLTRIQIYAWLAQHLSPASMEKETARRLRTAETEVARYFLTITIVNLGFGIAVTAAMTVIGTPAPLLWGCATFLLNYVLYLGPAIVFGSLLLAGLVAFDGGYSVVPAAAFLGLNLIEAQFVTPSAIGRAMRVNPLLIFVALVFFLWLWGPVGGFVAIPLLLWGLTLSKEITATRRDVRAEAEDPAVETA